MKRLLSVDILRAIAILLMVQVHFIQNLSPRRAASAGLYDISQVLGALAAPLFTFLAGLSLWLWLRKQTALGKDGPEMGARLARRGLTLFGVGLAFATLIWLPDQVFDWDILTLLGAALLILYPLRKLPSWALIGLVVLVLIVSPFLRELTGYEFHWDRYGEYLYDFTLRDVTLGFLLHGYFPILPWIVFPIAGYLTGKHFFDGRRVGWPGRWLAAIGVGLAALAGVGMALGERAPVPLWGPPGEIGIHPALTPYVLGTIGAILIALWALHRWLDERELSPTGPVLAFFTRYSRFALTVYIVHHAVHAWPLLLLAAWNGSREPWRYYADAVSTPTALLLTIFFVAAFYAVLIAWDRKGGRYSFEWLLRWSSG